MKIFINTPGDRSVGIWGDTIDIDMSQDYPHDELDKGCREAMRKSLSEFFTDFCDNGKAQVFFGDECQECGKVMELLPGLLGQDNHFYCMNEHCLSNGANDPD